MAGVSRIIRLAAELLRSSPDRLVDVQLLEHAPPNPRRYTGGTMGLASSELEGLWLVWRNAYVG
jgi:hypothetical protein